MTQDKQIRVRCWLFLAVLLGGLLYPLSLVKNFEFPSEPPRQYLLDLQGYDPRDLFRGRYIRFEVENAFYVFEDITCTRWNTQIPLHQYKYAGLSKDPKTGKVKFTPYKEPPEGGIDYIPLRSIYQDWEQRQELKAAGKDENGYQLYEPYHPRVIMGFPVNRFYVNERLAKPAEVALRKLSQEKRPIQLVVSVYGKGRYTLDDMLFDGVPFREYLKQNKQD